MFDLIRPRRVLSQILSLWHQFLVVHMILQLLVETQLVCGGGALVPIIIMARFKLEMIPRVKIIKFFTSANLHPYS